ncbi:MAG: methyltransferase [Planctomycetota bacterium]
MSKGKRRKGKGEAPTGIPRAKRAEQLLLEALPEAGEGPALCTTQGRGQLARGLGERGWGPVQCWFLDLAQRNAAVEVEAPPPGVEFVCAPDLPEGAPGLIALPVQQQGDGELTRDLIQQALQRLDPEGTLWLASDNPKDSWLRELLKKLPLKVSPEPHGKRGVVYRARPQGPLKRVRDYGADFAFRHGERLFEVRSLPGVFAHRRLDLGARALLESLPEELSGRVLEIGCGLGAVSLGVASQDPALEVLALDSNARAVACTRLNAEKNGIANVQVVHAAAEAYTPDAPCDLVLANPPYYSKGKIAAAFVDLAARALRPGGLLHLVTKRPSDYHDIYERGFADVEVEEIRGYQVLFGVRGDDPPRS